MEPKHTNLDKPTNKNMVDFGTFIIASGALRLFGSITDSLFRREERKLVTQEKEIERKYRSKEQRKAQDHAMKLHLEGIRLKAKLEEEAREKERRINEEIAKQNHENRKELVAQEHFNRIEEIVVQAFLKLQAQDREHRFQTKQLLLSHELQIIRDKISRQLAHENAKNMEEFRVTIAQLDRFLRRAEENSPFLDHPEAPREAYYKEFLSRGEKQPLVLVAGFYHDTIPNEADAKGGFLSFKEAISETLDRTLSQFVIKRSGYFKRPLRRQDRDIDIIREAFSDIPTILIHGNIKANIEVQPIITLWNLPGCHQDRPYKFPLEPLKIEQQNLDPGWLGIREKVAKEVTAVVGMLSDTYHLIVNGKRPNLKRYVLENPEQLKALADEFSFHYDLVCRAEPVKESFYRLDQAMMLGECGLRQEANQQAEKALMIWYQQKNKGAKRILPDLHLLCEKSDTNDLQFLNQLASFYQLVDANQKAAQVHQTIHDLREDQPLINIFQAQPTIDRFKP